MSAPALEVPPAVDTPAGPEARLIRLDRITPSPFNPRKTFPEAELAELAAAIAAEGVLVPLLVRPRPLLPLSSADPRAGEDGLVRIGMLERRPDDTFELVDGERRLRAAKLAGLVVAPCIVRELTDAQVRIIQIVANEQRADVPPLEKADGYAELIDRCGLSVEQVAEKVGRSAATIRGLLKLRRLPPAALEAVRAGRLPPQTAQLVAGVPNDKLREQCAAEVLAGRDYRYGPSARAKAEPMSYRETKEHIADRYMVELKQAPFSQKDEDLGAGACTGCPKRAGNDREAYPDSRADVCTDPACYKAKVEAFKKKVRSGAAGLAGTLLSEAECQRAFPWGTQVSDSSGYLDLADQCWEAKKPTMKQAPSYKQLLGKDLKPEEVLLAFDKKDQLHRLVKKDVAVPILRKVLNQGKPAPAAPAVRTSAEDREERARRLQEGKEKRAQERGLLAAIATAAGKVAARLPASDAALDQLLRVLIGKQAAALFSERLDAVCVRRSLGGQDTSARRKEVAALAADTTGPALFALLVELVGADQLFSWDGGGADGKQLLAALGVDRKQAEAAGLAELKAEGKGKKPKAAKGGRS